MLQRVEFNIIWYYYEENFLEGWVEGGGDGGLKGVGGIYPLKLALTVVLFDCDRPEQEVCNNNK